MKIAIPKTKIKKFKESFKKLPWAIAERGFKAFLALVWVALILGGFLFYKYIFSVEEGEIIERPIQFKEKLYRKILQTLEDRQKQFEEVELKEYLDPFRRLTK